MRLCALFKLDNFVGNFFYMVVNYNDVACESNLVLIFHATFNENLHVLVCHLSIKHNFQKGSLSFSFHSN